MAEATITGLRPFVPARDFALSKAFYAALGARLAHDGEKIALFDWGGAEFFVQDFFRPELAANFVVELGVVGLDALWRTLAGLDLPVRFGVRPPKPPERMPWGARVAFLIDPSGVLWHLAER